MMPQATEKEFIVQFRPLPESIVAVLVYRQLFVNEEWAGKENEALAWAKKMAATGKTHEIMWVS